MQNGTIECQHGKEECVINRFESCVIETITGTNAALPYIYCLEKHLEGGTAFEKAVDTCYSTLEIDMTTRNAIRCFSAPSQYRSGSCANRYQRFEMPFFVSIAYRAWLIHGHDLRIWSQQLLCSVTDHYSFVKVGSLNFMKRSR